MNVLDVFFPQKCLECKKEGCYICDGCLDKVSFSFKKCIECNRYSKGGITHKECKKEKSLDQLVSLWRHGGVVRKSLLSIKYKFTSDIAKELIDRYIEKLDYSFLPKNGILIPVPLHKKRKRWRGFNQSENLGRLVSKKLSWEFIPDLLVRTKNTIPQTGLRKVERKKNVKEAFSLNPKYVNVKFSNNTFIIFDDTLTTGSTLKECGRILKISGIKKVIGMTICG